MIYRKERQKTPSVDGLFDGLNIATLSGNAVDSPTISRGRAGIINPSVGLTRSQVLDFLIYERGSLYESVQKKIHVADGQKALFLPFLGEVGWRAMWHTKLVHLSEASHKTVCCMAGQECFYPSADEFKYDWTDPYHDSEREGTDRMHRSWMQFDRRLADIFIQGGGLSIAEEEVAALLVRGPDEIKPCLRRGLQATVCIATRRRNVAPRNNYEGWPVVARWLSDRRVTFAVIGDRNTSSFPLDGQVCMSGDFNDFDAAFELLENCHIFVGTDSGGAHLAALSNACPMIVQETSSRYRVFTDAMSQTTTWPVKTIPYANWNKPEAIIEVLEKELL